MNMKKNSRILLYFSIGFIVILTAAAYYGISITGRSIENTNQKQTVKIGYRAHILYLPAYVAYTKGYFSDQGLNAELVKFESTNDLVNALLAGHIDAGIGGVNTNVVFTILLKDPNALIIFGTADMPKDANYILTRKNSGIHSVKDLENKTFGTISGTAGVSIAKIILESEDIVNAVKIVEIPQSQHLSSLEAGSADAIYTLEPLKSIGESLNITMVLIEGPYNKYFMKNGIWLSSVMTKSFYENNQAADKIIKATDKAAEFIRDNPEEAKLLYSEFTDSSPEISKSLPIAEYRKSTEIDRKNLELTMQTMLEKGMVSK